MKKIGLFLLFCAVGAGMLFFFVPRKILRNIYLSAKTSKFEKRKAEPVLATFDWNTKNLKANADSFQYINFRVSDSKIEPATVEIDKTLPIFITVDMWNLFIKENPLEAVVKGSYDEKIKEMCSFFSDAPNPVYIRWNPEMEVPANIYPWQGQSLMAYNEAFEYFATLCRKWLPRAKIVWSTAGYPGVLEYYPGDDFVDYIAVTLDNASEKSTKAYPAYQSLADQIERKIYRMRFLDKPVIVLGQYGQGLNSRLVRQFEVAAGQIRNHENLIYNTLSAPGIKANTFQLRENLSVGVYDPEKKLAAVRQISLEHLFPNWKDLKSGSFYREFNAIIARNHDVIVTMEPWRETDGQTEPDVLTNTINGTYDERLRELFSVLSKTDRTVYLRWTHEMEIPVTRYPWQSQPPINYIKAFRHFASFKKPGHTNIKIVFGPAGDRGLQDFWPGDDVVDFISMAIYGLPDKNITDHNKQLSFEKIFTGKLRRMRFFDKPIIISEFGIKGPNEYQLKWLMNASKTINTHPEIKAVCYFNMSDTPKAWGDIEAPDWRISQETFRSFIQSLDLRTQTNAVAQK